LARIYGIEIKAFNRAVKRNADRFPPVSFSTFPERNLIL
jgi:hypothetical protein